MTLEKYVNVLKTTNEIALATSVDNLPDVRVVNFCFDFECPGVLYFASDRTNRKVGQFKKNNAVSFTTIPKDGGIPHVRSIRAAVQKSGRTMTEMAPLFVAAIPGYDEAIAAIGDALEVFEIHIKEAVVITGFEAPDIISFE